MSSLWWLTEGSLKVVWSKRGMSSGVCRTGTSRGTQALRLATWKLRGTVGKSVVFNVGIENGME